MTIDESACVDNILLRSNRIATVDTAVIAYEYTVLIAVHFSTALTTAVFARPTTSIPKYLITLLFAHFSK